MTRKLALARGYFTHPVTRRQMQVTAGTQHEIDGIRVQFRTMRRELKFGLVSADEVKQKLARLVSGRPTVRKAAEAYRDSGLAQNTRRRVDVSLAHALAPIADLELEQLDVPRVSEWLAGLRGKHEPSSVQAHWWLLRSIARTAIERGWLVRLPWGDWRPRLVSGPPTDRECCRDLAELERLLESARAIDALPASQETAGDLEAKGAAIACLGIRQGELGGLRWGDVDQAAGTVAIARQYDGRPVKHRKHATVLRAPAGLFEILERWRVRAAARGWVSDDGPIFPHPDLTRIHGRPMHHRNGEVLRIAFLRRAVMRAGLPRPDKWNAQSLRDTYATLEAAAAGSDLPRVSGRMRHASMKSTLHYLRGRQRGSAEPGFELAPRAADRQLLLPGAGK